MKSILYLFLFVALLDSDYKQEYYKGFDAYSKKDYKTAVGYFSKSYSLKTHSKTSYYMAMCYFKLKDDKLAHEHAKRAQTELPLLAQQPYQADLKFICDFYNKDASLVDGRYTKFEIVMSPSPYSDDVQYKEEVAPPETVTVTETSLKKVYNTGEPEAVDFKTDSVYVLQYTVVVDSL